MKQKPKPKADQYKRFLETAKAVEASDDPKDFDRAFNGVATKASPPIRGRTQRQS